jgi:hypothetical protein
VPSDRENCTRLFPIVQELKQPIREGVGVGVAALNRSGGKVRLIGLDLDPRKSGRLRGQGVRGSGRSGYRVEPYLCHRLGVGWFTGSGLSAGRVRVGRLVRLVI